VSQESNSQIQDFLDWKDLGKWEEPHAYYKTYTAHNPLCGDQISLHCSRFEDQIKIESLQGEACSVCLASAGILYDHKRNWNLESLNSYLVELENFLNDSEPLFTTSSAQKKFWNVMKVNPGRHRCAFLPFQALKKAF